MTGIVIVRQQMGGKGGFVRLPQEFGSFLVHACRSHQVGKLQPCFECCILPAIALCPIQIDTKIMDGRIADICLVLLIDFPIPSKKRNIGGIGIQHLALQPGNASFTHGDIVPVRLDSSSKEDVSAVKEGVPAAKTTLCHTTTARKQKVNNLLSMTIKFMQI